MLQDLEELQCIAVCIFVTKSENFQGCLFISLQPNASHKSVVFFFCYIRYCYGLLTFLSCTFITIPNSLDKNDIFSGLLQREATCALIDVAWKQNQETLTNPSSSTDRR